MPAEPDVAAQAGGRIEWIEVVIATVLSVAGLMTSWSSYQASLWDGEQAAHYSRANAVHITASRIELETDARRNAQIGLFNAWLQAKAGGNEKLTTFYEERFPSDFKPAFQAWLALKPLKNPEAPPSPFAMDSYHPPGLDRAAKLEAEADATYAAGQRANAISDIYTQGTVFLAMALFFGGIGQVFKIWRVRLGLLAIAILSCGVGIAKTITLPTLSPG